MPLLDENSLRLMLESLLNNALRPIKADLEQLKLNKLDSGEKSIEEKAIERRRTLERLK